VNCVILIERPFGLYIELQEDTPNPRLEGYDYTTLNSYIIFAIYLILKPVQNIYVLIHIRVMIKFSGPINDDRTAFSFLTKDHTFLDGKHRAMSVLHIHIHPTSQVESLSKASFLSKSRCTGL